MNYYRCIEDDRIFSESDLHAEYLRNIATDPEYEGVSFSRYLGLCMTRNNGSLERVYPFSVTVNVECFDRWLTVEGFSTMSGAEIFDILESRYYQWHNPEEFPDAEFCCCEEWMLMGLDELGISYTPIYSEDEEDMCR